MMRLNGWRRIGVVLSVVWIVAGGLWTRGIVVDDLGRFAKNQFSFCLDMQLKKPSPIGDECSRQFEADWKRDVTDGGLNALNAASTFIPLLVACLIAYGLVGLTRWIRADFAA